jgi:hypothetical protein
VLTTGWDRDVADRPPPSPDRAQPVLRSASARRR